MEPVCATRHTIETRTSVVRFLFGNSCLFLLVFVKSDAKIDYLRQDAL